MKMVFTMCMVLASALVMSSVAFGQLADIELPNDKLAQQLTQLRQEPAPDVNTPQKIVEKTKSVSLSEDAVSYTLSSADLSIKISKETGLIFDITSNKPAPVSFYPPTEYGLTAYILNRTSEDYEVLQKVEGISYEADEANDSITLKGTGVLTGIGKQLLGTIPVTYTLSSEKLEITFDIAYKVDDPSQFEIGIVQAYNPSKLTRVLYLDRVEPVTTDKKRRFLDRLSETQGNKTYFAPYPETVLEMNDRYVMWGYFDLNHYVIMAPNYCASAPVFMIRPKGVTEGETYSFNLFCKVFPKTDNTYTEVVRYYLEHMYSTNPLTADLFPVPRDLQNRTIPAGGVSFFYPPKHSFPKQYYDEKFFDLIEEHSRKLKVTNLWYSVFYSFDETYPTEGEWFTTAGYKVNAKDLKTEVKRVQDAGFKVYFYFRQLYPTVGLRDDRPPYKKWMFHNKNDELVAWGNSWTIDPKVVESWGLTDKLTGHDAYIFGDFSNPEFRQWYENEVKRAIEFYNPDGIAWDMGWYDMYLGASFNYPDQTYEHGILKVQADIYKWLKATYPDKYVIQNWALGMPNQIFADAVMFEASSTKDAADVAKALNTSILMLSYADFIEPWAGKNYPQEHKKMLMRTLSWGGSAGVRGIDLIDYDGPTSEMMNRWPWGEGLVGNALYLNEMTDFFDFSAEVANFPLVTESYVLKITPPADKLYGSLWADKRGLRVACFNETGESKDVTLSIDLNILNKYGYTGDSPAQVILLGADGLPKDVKFSETDDMPGVIKISAAIGDSELLLIRK